MDLGLIRYQNGGRKVFSSDKEKKALADKKIRVEEVSLDEYIIYCDATGQRWRYYNCKNVSEAFLKDIIRLNINDYLDDWWDQEVGETDMEKLLDECIQDGAWDWHEEVKERKTHGHIVF